MVEIIYSPWRSSPPIHKKNSNIYPLKGGSLEKGALFRAAMYIYLLY